MESTLAPRETATAGPPAAPSDPHITTSHENQHPDSSRQQELAEDHDHIAPPATLGQKIAMLTAVVLPFLGVIAAVVLLWQYGWVDWPYLVMLVVGWMLTGLGVTVGFHRLLSHRSFQTYSWIRAFWTAMGAASVEGSPIVWAAIHRRHHSRSDKPGDPHSPNLHGGGFWGTLRGLWHGQVGWLFTGYWSEPELQRYVPDLLRDRAVRLVSDSYMVVVAVSLLIPALVGYLIGGWHGALLGFLWGGLVRVFVTHHVTWSINSVCHVFGQRHFHSSDHSTNHWFFGLFGFGEGWHNNHHAFPFSARHGHLWWQLDAGWWVIRGMQAVGLAWDVRIPNRASLAEKRLS